MIEPAELAWCAGIIDALGLIRLRETGETTLLPYVGVSTPHHAIGKRLAELTGTSVTQVKRDYNRLGCTEHCTLPHLHVQSHTIRWSLTGARATLFLRAIRPYVHYKAQTIDEVLAETENAPYKPRTVEKMRALGWAS